MEDVFKINQQVSQKFPSISIGIAVIREVAVSGRNEDLWKNIEEFIHENAHLTNEEIGSYGEVQSYRKLYKEMGVDWHSRRPSPEALLRRISKGKGLYQINTCVDAYNLVVLRNRVSVGAFDIDKMSLPTELRFAADGESIRLIGDREETKYKTSELAYFDRLGGYNIDFNYRDSERTAVTEVTKNILINVDGIYEISREQVERTLDESIAEIMKYCGGKVEMSGVVCAN